MVSLIPSAAGRGVMRRYSRISDIVAPVLPIGEVKK